MSKPTTQPQSTPTPPHDIVDWTLLIIAALFWLSLAVLALIGRWLPQLCPWAANAFNHNPQVMLCVVAFTLTRGIFALSWPTQYWRCFQSPAAQFQRPHYRFVFWISFTAALFWFTSGPSNAPTWLWVFSGFSCFALIAPYANESSDDYLPSSPMTSDDYTHHAAHYDDSMPTISSSMEHTYPAGNPTTGLAMIGNSGCDAGGNPFGYVPTDDPY